METEHCIHCGEPTSYKKSDHVDTRSGYIEGAGQLCLECHKEMNWSTNTDIDLWLCGE